MAKKPPIGIPPDPRHPNERIASNNKEVKSPKTTKANTKKS